MCFVFCQFCCFVSTRLRMRLIISFTSFYSRLYVPTNQKLYIHLLLLLKNEKEKSFIPEVYRNTEETAHRHELYYEASSTGEGERASHRHKRKTSRQQDGRLIFGVISTIVLNPVHISHSRRTGGGEEEGERKRRQKCRWDIAP